jgi:small subunit ribosomal protein S5e
MMTGRNNGKKLMAARIVQHAFEIVHLLTDANPLQILVDAIINCGPREDSTRIGSQGTVRRQAVDVSPLRRVNQAISLLTVGTRESAFRNVKTVAECLADELINAAKGSANSYGIKKKDELERVAKCKWIDVLKVMYMYTHSILYSQPLNSDILFSQNLLFCYNNKSYATNIYVHCS